MRIIFAGGGTGGHLYPAIAIAEELHSRGHEFHFLVSDRGIDARILTKLGYRYTEQHVTAFAVQGMPGKLKALVNLALTVVKTFPLIKKGDKVIMTGGFASAPAAVIAKLKGAELYLHEQNSVMGIVNGTFARFSKKVFLAFEETKNAKGNTVVTGNPVRRVFSRFEGKANFTGNILVLGGSQGSRAINKLIVASIDKLMDAGYSVTHQTGEGLYGETIKAYGNAAKKYNGKLSVKPYIDGIASVMNESDIVISRSGSGVIFELKAMGRPALYIPFKQASANHQQYNAEEMVEKGFAQLITEDEASPELLVAKIESIKNNYAQYREAFTTAPKVRSVEMILREASVD